MTGDVWWEPAGAAVEELTAGWYHPLGAEWFEVLRVSLFGEFM